MATQFIIGRARSGKTASCYNQIEAHLKEGGYHSLFLLVPEQFSLQTQIELSERFFPGLLRVEIITFKGLAQAVLKEVGKDKVPLIDDLERIMILKKVIEEHKKELKFFKKAYGKEGFLEAMNQLITIFEQNDMTLEAMETIEKDHQATTLFQSKWEDVRNIYTWFNEAILNHFMTAEKTLSLLVENIEKSSWLQHNRLWIDGFYGFTTMQLKVIAKLCKVMVQTTITLPGDKIYEENEYLLESNPFYESIKAHRLLVGLLREQNDLEITSKVCERGNEIEKTLKLELQYLEENYLKPYTIPYEGENKAIYVRQYSSTVEEVENLAKTITNLVREENYRYHDIGVIVGDLNTYKSHIERLFNEYEIPCFLDMKKGIHTHHFIACIKALLDSSTQNWSYKSMMQLLRTQMIDVTQEEVDLVENYLLEHGIKSCKAWQEEWTLSYSECTLEVLNAIRERIIRPLKLFEEKLKGYKLKKGQYKVADLTKVVYSFMEEIQAYTKIQSVASKWQEKGYKVLELENKQIWDEVMGVLERLVTILGEEEMSLGLYKNILNASFSYIELGLIPPSKDQVIVGSLERTRLPQLKALFVLGTNEGVMPPLSTQGEIFSDMDKRALSSICQNKGDNLKRLKDILVTQNLYGAKFLIYSALTRAKEKLYITSPLSDEQGKALRPAMLFYKMKRMFKQEEAKRENLLDHVYAPLPTLSYAGRALRQDMEGIGDEEDTDWKDVISWYVENSAWQEKLKTMSQEMFYTNQQHYLKKETANSLYPEKMETSVSQLERFRSCACCYFIKYGLKAEERKLFKWNTRDLGTIFHATLERYPKELEAKGFTWVSVPKEEKDKCIKQAVVYSVDKYNRTGEKNGKFKYTASKLERMAKRAINALTYQLEQGKFEPKAYEVGFGYEGMPPISIAIDETHTLLLRGQIDRIDVYLGEDNQNYAKILDYKSGKKDFDLLQVYYGLQLQLLLYLDAYLKLNKTFDPAGVFYFHIDKAYLSYKVGMTEEDIDTKQVKQYKLSGLVLEDTKVIRLLEESGKGEVVPASIKKDGDISKKSSVADEKQFEMIRSYITDTIRGLGKEILEGKVSAKPYKLGKSEPCTYCQYHTICQFDSSQTDNVYEQLPVLKQEEIWQKVCKKKGEENNGLDDGTTSSN